MHVNDRVHDVVSQVCITCMNVDGVYEIELCYDTKSKSISVHNVLIVFHCV